MDLSTKYQKKTDKQHVLDNPDTYIGSVETVDATHWMMEGERILPQTHLFVPGLFKLFDEAIVNCRDHVVRMAATNPVTYIHVDITEDGTLSFTNDGDGIDVALHPEHGVYIPELIFGHLRTSTNYDKNEKKIVGGKNGFGVKSVIISILFLLPRLPLIPRNLILRSPSSLTINVLDWMVSMNLCVKYLFVVSMISQP